MSTTLTPVLSAFWDDARSWTLETYERNGGYQALRAAVTDGARRGRHHGQGLGPARPRRRRLPDRAQVELPAQADGRPRYLVVNADESEPGTCKDTPLMLATPQFLIEGVLITAYAIRAEKAFIYVRGEILHVYRRLLAAVAEARAAGYVGENVLGAGFDVDIVVHAGAGAYICGEETALLDSLEGRRGQPRLKPPFPAVAGLYARPTVVNNVESIASVPSIVRGGADWFKSMGTERSTGYGLFSLSGHVARPGQYEAPLGITLRELLDMAGGVRQNHSLKFWTPGRLLHAAVHARAPRHPARLRVRRRGGFDARHPRAADLRRDHLRRARRPALDRVLQARVVRQVHAPAARARTGWWDPAAAGEREGSEEDLTKLLDICDNILGRSFCALGDGATSPITSSIQYFRDEYLEHLTHGGCPFDPVASTVFAGANA
jgi:NADH-quinone oxidoreductase subunit F